MLDLLHNASLHFRLRPKIFNPKINLMKKSIYLLLLIFILSFISFNASVAQNKTWIFPDKLVRFSPTPSVTSLPNNTGITSNQSYNAMQDANGNLLFYVVDGSIYDADGNWIDNILNNEVPGNLAAGFPEVCLVPVPSSCTKYYIIAAEATSFSVGSNPMPFYVTLDMSLPNPNNNNLTQGALVGQNSITINQNVNYAVHANTMHLAVSKIRSNNTRYLFVSDNSYLFRFPITSTGIGAGTIAATLGGGYNSNDVKAEMELFEHSNGNYTIATVEKGGITCSGNQATVFLYNFNSSNTLVSTQCKAVAGTAVADCHGLEFSSNGGTLYLTHATSPYIEALDLTSLTLTTPPSVSNASDFKESQIELAADGKLYFAAANRLARITGADNPTTATWENNALAISIPTDFFGVRIVQDQIDQENYGNVFNASAQCCDNNTYWNKTDYTAGFGSITWTGSSNPLNGNTGTVANIRNTLTIPSGSNITISGMTLNFGLDGKITIQPGGRLVINNTVLKGNTTCQNMWQGVEVIGSGQNGQPNQWQQGQFESENNSRIENAIVGAQSSSFNSSLTSTYGGFIRCTNTTFYNCRSSVKFWSHNNNANYSSSINSCSFDGTTLWYPYLGSRPEEHIHVFDCRGGTVPANGVDVVFQTTTNHTTLNNAVYGFNLTDNRNIVLQYIDINNCTYGIWSGIASLLQPSGSILSNLTFSACYASIFLKYTNADVIANNVFNAGYGPQDLNFYGIYSDGAYNFHINDNVFKHLKYGIWCSNSGSVGGRISSNSGNGNVFYECWRGIDCRGNNQNLLIKCNQFFNAAQSNNEYSTAWYIGGDLGNQGSTCNNSTCPAGNEFFRSGNRKDLYAVPGLPSCSTFNFCYFRHSSPSSCVPLLYTPTTIRVNVVSVQRDASSCLGQGLMELANNTPDSAKLIIENEPDSIKKQLWIDELIAWYQQHQMEADAKAFLETRYDDPAMRMLFPMYISNQEFNKAQDILNSYCGEPDDESQAFCTLNGLILSWAIGGVSPFDMNETEYQSIKSIAEGLTQVAPQAQSLLKMVYFETIEPWHPSDTGEARLASNLIQPIQLPIMLSPVPCKSGSMARLQFDDELSGNVAMIRITDGSGRVFTTIHAKIEPANALELPTSELSVGWYLVEVRMGNGTPYMLKLLIN